VKIFISFSSNDLEFVREFFYRLKSQNLRIWDYSQRGDEIPFGEEITGYLKKQIDNSEYFISIISKNSTDKHIGRFTRLELSRAIDNGMLEKNKIIPVILNGEKPDINDLYQNILNGVFFECRQDDSDQIEKVVEKICNYLGVKYNSPFMADSRLPFKEKFKEEILSNISVTNSNYNELMTIIDDFFKFYPNNWLKAWDCISYFIYKWNFLFQENSYYPQDEADNKTAVHNFKNDNYSGLEEASMKELYYPQIIKGICALQLGKFTEAEEIFLRAAGHAKKNEICFGGLGQVYYRQGRNRKALESYFEALKYSTKGPNLEIKFNILSLQHEMGIMDNVYSDILDELKNQKLHEDDYIKVLNLEAGLKYQNKLYIEAIAILDKLIKKGIHDETTVIYYYFCLRELGKYNEALNFLKKESETRDEEILYHYLALYYVQLKKINESLVIYEKKLCDFKYRTRRYFVEYARLLKYNKNREKMITTCELVLDHIHFDNPQKPEDYYYDGFANYLLGRDERAKYDFERSGNLFQYYDEYDL
jgi:tetratricopeptide (TPR) repeat protein